MLTSFLLSLDVLLAMLKAFGLARWFVWLVTRFSLRGNSGCRWWLLNPRAVLNVMRWTLRPSFTLTVLAVIRQLILFVRHTVIRVPWAWGDSVFTMIV